MNTDERKQYNKTYYENNKDRIKTYLYRKIECEMCKRQVARNNILRHYNTSICQRTLARKKMIQQQLLTLPDGHTL